MASMQVTKQTQVSATLSNQTYKVAHLERYFNFSEVPTILSPEIPAHGAIRLKDLGHKAAVQYDGFNTREAPISWILAWESPESCHALHKVFVMCGTKCAMDHVTEEQILAGLKNGSPEAGAMDVNSNSSVQAAIVPGIGTSEITANFGLVR